jgi:hypothetical protein
MTREFGVVNKKLEGPKAESLVSLARTLLGVMKQRMKLGDVPQLRWTRANIAGFPSCTIQVSSSFGQDSIEIFTPEEGVKERLVCPPTKNGLIEVLYPNHLIVEEDPPGVFTTKLLQFYASEPDPITGANRWMNEEFFVPQQNNLIFKPPGKYSGLMRLVVQDHHSHAFDVPYEYGYLQTHGIYIGSDNKPWLIEVGRDGVYAFALTTLDECTDSLLLNPDDPDNPGFYPLATTFPEDKTTEGVIILFDAADMADVYNGAPMFNDCGWAFSANGHQISNIFWEWNGKYKYSRLYTILITEGINSKTQAPEPMGVSLANTEEGYLWGDRITHPKFPNGTNGVLSFDLFYNVTASPSSNIQAPLFCWYDGEDLQVVRFHKNSTGTTIFTSSPKSYDVWGHTGAYNTNFGIVWSENGPIPVGSTGAVNGFTSPLFTTAPSGHSESRPGESTVQNVLSEYGEEYLISPRGAASIDWDAMPGGVAKWETWTDYTKDVNYVDIIIVPVHDRESVYHYRRGSDHQTSSFYASVHTYFMVGQVHLFTDKCGVGEITIGGQIHAWVSCTPNGLFLSGKTNTNIMDYEGVPFEHVADYCPNDGGCVLPQVNHTELSDFDQQLDLGFDTTIETREAKAWIGGEAKNVLAPEESQTTWERWIDLENTVQFLLVAADNSENVDHIYSELPFPLSGYDKLGATLTGPDWYPYEDIVKIFTFYVGDPTYPGA